VQPFGQTAGSSRAWRRLALGLQLFRDGIIARLLVRRLSFLWCFSEPSLGSRELIFEFVYGLLQIVVSHDCRLGIGRICEMDRVIHAGPFLFGLNMTLNRVCRSIQIGDQSFHLCHLPAHGIDLQLFQPDERLSNPVRR
jgi:hypothetical protein